MLVAISSMNQLRSFIDSSVMPFGYCVLKDYSFRNKRFAFIRFHLRKNKKLFTHLCGKICFYVFISSA